MVVPAIFFVLVRPVDAYIGKFTSAPTETFPSLPVVWFQNWSWLLFVIPLSLVLLLISYRTAVITPLAMGPVLFIGIVSLDDFDDYF